MRDKLGPKTLPRHILNITHADQQDVLRAKSVLKAQSWTCLIVPTNTKIPNPYTYSLHCRVPFFWLNQKYNKDPVR